VRRAALPILRCPLCGGAVEPEGRPGDEIDEGVLRCLSCGEAFEVERGIPLMVSDRLPGMREKRGEIEGWVEKAKSEDWYEPDDDVDAVLPYVCRDLGWDDPVWEANEYSFSRLLDRWVRPGMKVLEVGAAKGWAAQHLVPRGCGYVATDVLVDEKIGIGRAAFYVERAGQFERVQADGEHLPFADRAFDLTYCVATLHHALDLPRMVSELARVTRRGGVVAGLNEGTRPIGWNDDAPGQRGEKALGINEHTHTAWAYLAAFVRARILVRELYPANGQVLGRDGAWGIFGTLRAHTMRGSELGYDGISLVGTKL
jgi:SAM-dependent methyltransferase